MRLSLRVPCAVLAVLAGQFTGELRAGELLPPQDTRAAMEKIMGPLPGAEKRCPLDVQLDLAEDAGSYVRRLITYQSEPGSRVPAYLLVPKAALQGGGRLPAMLCLHPTDNIAGHKVVVGLGGKANRQYAQELAERGYVTLAPAYPLLAKYQPDVLGLGYESGTMKAIWDNLRGLDLLQSLSYVDGDRIGAIGHSLGGHNAIYTAVFDERIKVVVSSCGFDSFEDYYRGRPEVWQPGKGWTQLRYMPKLAEYAGRQSEIPFDFDDLLASLAPRPVFVSAPLHDSNFNWESVDRLAARVRPVFAARDAADQFVVVHPDCPHDFPDDIRQQAYEFIDKALKDGAER